MMEREREERDGEGDGDGGWGGMGGPREENNERVALVNAPVHNGGKWAALSGCHGHPRLLLFGCVCVKAGPLSGRADAYGDRFSVTGDLRGALCRRAALSFHYLSTMMMSGYERKLSWRFQVNIKI